MRPMRWMVVFVGMALVSADASAQVIGTFPWQTQPYCNRVVLTVIQQGGVYQLNGTDDQCGAGVAPVTGTAIPTASGVAMGFTVSLGSGRASHVSASISFASLSGTWTDADGLTGTFVFQGAAAGSPRPGPALAALATIPSGVTVTGQFMFDGHQPAAPAGSDAFSVMLPALAPAPLTDAVVNFGNASGAGDADPTCTGTFFAPTAPRGKVCIYVFNSSGFPLSSALGGVLALPKQSFNVSFVPSGGGGDLYLYATWAYTAP